MRAVLLSGLLICALPAVAAPIGAPLAHDGMTIAASWRTGVEMDHALAGTASDSMHLEADIRAAKDEGHGFALNAFIPYLTVNYALTRDGAPTFKKSGLLYPMVSRDGPHYGAAVQMSGAGVYHLTYIISPPSSHGMLRHVDKASGVPDWWKPIAANWTFNYPSEAQ